MLAKQHPTHFRIALPMTIAALGLSALPLVGCGGSSGSSATAAAATTTTHTQAARPTPRGSNADVGIAPAQQASQKETGSSRHKSHALGRPQAPAGSVGAAGKVQKARTNKTTEIDENPGPPKAANPCRLVSRSEAQSIVGHSIAASIEAPLGPTCIYQLSGSKTQITLQVERLSYGQATHQLSKRSLVSVGDRKALCGSLGTQMLFVPLADGQVLHVTAPCAVAQRFAALALKRLTA
jgi:hypothetical protein